MTPFRGKPGASGDRFVYEPPKDSGGKKPESAERAEQEPTRKAQGLAVEVKQLFAGSPVLEARANYFHYNEQAEGKVGVELSEDGSESIELDLRAVGDSPENAKFSLTYLRSTGKPEESLWSVYHIGPQGIERSTHRMGGEQRALVDQTPQAEQERFVVEQLARTKTLLERKKAPLEAIDQMRKRP